MKRRGVEYTLAVAIPIIYVLTTFSPVQAEKRKPNFLERITGSTATELYQNRRPINPNRDRNNEIAGRIGKEALKRHMPYNWTLDAAKRFGRKYSEFRKKRKNVVTGTGIIRNYKRKR